MEFLHWISVNKSWLFEGVGVSILIWIVWLIRRIFGSKEGNNQKQQSGNNSINIQSGKTININQSELNTKKNER